MKIRDGIAIIDTLDCCYDCAIKNTCEDIEREAESPYIKVLYKEFCDGYQKEVVMADFNSAFEKTVAMEGGYVNHPDDPGGETNFGISKRAYPDLDIKNLTREQAKVIYLRDYWVWLQLSAFTVQEVAEEVFDTAVNAGVFVAARFLQRSINLLVREDALRVDSKIGPITANAVNRYGNTKALLKTLNGLQFMHYHNLVIKNPKLRAFFVGWLRRV